MFTGLIESTGSVLSVERATGATQFVVALPSEMAARLTAGDSVAVSGVCLTALDITVTGPGAHFRADLAAETIDRTSLSRLRPGATVNLELPTPAGAPLGGHIVQGHVDAVGRILALEPVSPAADLANTDWVLRVEVPGSLGRYIVKKGSITIEGISLTVAEIETNIVTIAIIPHTYAGTNLHTLSAGSEVNIEVDVLAKYAEQREQSIKAGHPKPELTLSYLIANGY